METPQTSTPHEPKQKKEQKPREVKKVYKPKEKPTKEETGPTDATPKVVEAVVQEVATEATKVVVESSPKESQPEKEIGEPKKTKKAEYRRKEKEPVQPAPVVSPPSTVE